jgi:hypothetical protein
MAPSDLPLNFGNLPGKMDFGAERKNFHPRELHGEICFTAAQRSGWRSGDFCPATGSDFFPSDVEESATTLAFLGW